jgi:hypothetical protein
MLQEKTNNRLKSSQSNSTFAQKHKLLLWSEEQGKQTWIPHNQRKENTFEVHNLIFKRRGVLLF